jgi:1,4-alpha-glucan branching enzyme
LSSDSHYYGGSNLGNDVVATEPTPWMEQPHSIVLTVPPLGAVVLVPG